MKIVIRLQQTRIGWAASTADGRVALFMKGAGRMPTFHQARRLYLQSLLNTRADVPETLEFEAIDDDARSA